MKVWIVEYKGEIVGVGRHRHLAVMDAGEVVARHRGEIGTWDAIDGDDDAGNRTFIEARGATIRLVDIAALERVAAAAQAWRKEARRWGPGGRWEAQARERRVAHAEQGIVAAIDALDVGEAREQVRRGETCTEAEFRVALGVDDAARGEEG